MTVKNNLELVKYLKSKLELPTIYMLGGIGRMLTNAMVDARIAKGDKHTKTNEKIIRAAVGKAYAFDCNALAKASQWEISPGVIKYDAKIDLGSKSLYNLSKKKGPINTMPDLPGLIVWTADLGHMGFYIEKKNGINQYIEATPAWKAWGVTTSADKDHPQGHNRKWAYWGEYHLIDYVQQVQKPDIDLDRVAREVIYGTWGNGVDRINRLTKAGYDYSAVQKRVNEIIREQKDNTTERIAQEVITGKWGNGMDRFRRLSNAGYNYGVIQKRVNEILKSKK